MVKVMKKFGGAIMLYMVIFFGIVAIVSRVGYMNESLHSISDATLATSALEL